MDDEERRILHKGWEAGRLRWTRMYKRQRFRATVTQLGLEPSQWTAEGSYQAFANWFAKAVKTFDETEKVPRLKRGYRMPPKPVAEVPKISSGSLADWIAAMTLAAIASDLREQLNYFADADFVREFSGRIDAAKNDKAALENLMKELEFLLHFNDPDFYKK